MRAFLVWLGGGRGEGFMGHESKRRYLRYLRRFQQPLRVGPPFPVCALVPMRVSAQQGGGGWVKVRCSICCDFLASAVVCVQDSVESSKRCWTRVEILCCISCAVIVYSRRTPAASGCDNPPCCFILSCCFVFAQARHRYTGLLCGVLRVLVKCD